MLVFQRFLDIAAEKLSDLSQNVHIPTKNYKTKRNRNDL